MHVKVLGSAAGGGFPQWNCACSNCRRLRSGQFSGRPRSQTQVAITEDGRDWFLLGASPDLRAQIESCPELHPKDRTRSSPISGVVLTAAELDHVLGLLMLREFQPLSVYATASVARILTEANSMFRMLDRVDGQTRWQRVRPNESFRLLGPSGDDLGITCMPIPLPGTYPAYVQKSEDFAAEEAALGLIVSSGGRKLGFFPSVASITPELRKWLATSDLVLFDGTFFEDDELRRRAGTGPQAREMGHIPVGGENGSLRQLAGLNGQRKVFIHINNTNPMLDESGAEYRAVREAGWELAEDGWQAVL
jgi:pyrroloquinoline quinone biosynthesis protein B